MRIRTAIWATGFLTAAIALIGCQSNGSSAYPATVTGKVTYNGSPVGAGSVTFITADGTPIRLPIRSDGTYYADDLPEGPMTVTVETESSNPERKHEDYRGQNSGGGMASKYGAKAGGGAAAPKGKGMTPYTPSPEGAGGGKPNYVKIPAKYADKTKSGLSVTLKHGKQTYDIPLTD